MVPALTSIGNKKNAKRISMNDTLQKQSSTERMNETSATGSRVVKKPLINSMKIETENTSITETAAKLQANIG